MKNRQMLFRTIITDDMGSEGCFVQWDLDPVLPKHNSSSFGREAP
jgi:hypothetical protein